MITKFFVVLLIFACLACQPTKKDGQVKETIFEVKKDTSKQIALDTVSTDTVRKVIVNDKQKQGIVTNVIRQYCQSLSEKDYKKLESLFTDSVAEYGSLRKTTPQLVTQYAKNLLGSKKKVYYSAEYKYLTISDYTAKIPISYIWDNYEGNIEAEIVFDEAFNIISFKERPSFKSKEVVDAKIWIGEYEGENESIYVRKVEDKELDIAVIFGKLSCNTEWEGKITLLTPTTARIKSKQCEVLFSLYKNQLEVKNKPANCQFENLRCSFGGIYTKKK